MSVFTNPADAAADAAPAYVEAVLDLLGRRDPIEVLERTPAELRDVIRGVPEDVLAHREEPGRWSVRHVLAHLADSELVWAVRLRRVLAEDRPVLYGYDQDAWANRLGYEDADSGESLDAFAETRARNLALLGRMADGDLDRSGVHDERGEESVRHMIRLYAGHDLLHLAQSRRILAAASRAQQAAPRAHQTETIDE